MDQDTLYVEGTSSDENDIEQIIFEIRTIFNDKNIGREQKLETLSELLKGESVDYNLCWEIEAEKIAQVITKIETIASAMELPGFTSVLWRDMENLVAQCRTAEFQIAIVGVMKAGKSMLMNALMGVEVASVDINPETASLTKFRSISSGNYVKVKFHSREEWQKFKASVKKSSGGELKKMIEFPDMEELAEKWTDHEEIIFECNSIEEVKEKVEHWTSARSKDHLFASEVEVGIERQIFNMPDEVVFVDTPGLQDPVQYRSDITKSYIRKANAVLIAVPTAALTAEGLETITTVLDYVGSNKEKAYIVATQKDKIKSNECDRVIKGWIKHLVSAKRYQDEEEARSHLIVTSAYMYLQLLKFMELNENDLDNSEKFSDDEYAELESYAKKIIKNKRYHIESLWNPEKKVDLDQLKKDAGILKLRRYLERKLIVKYRDLKLKDIQAEFLRCRKELFSISKTVIQSQNVILESAQKGADELRKRLDESCIAYENAREKNEEIREAAKYVRKMSEQLIENL